MRLHARDALQAGPALGEMARGVEREGFTMALTSLPDGTDLCDLPRGTPHDHCQCPNWGCLLEGRIRVDDQDGSSEIVEAGDI